MKKVVASVLVKDRMVVNAVGFNDYRPVSSLFHTIMRLQEWEIDEIAVLNLSHTSDPVMDFKELLSQEVLSVIRTPLSFGGGIVSAQQAESVISAGCERIVLSSRTWTPQTSTKLSSTIGDQAVLMHVPLSSDMKVPMNNQNMPIREYLEKIPTHWGGEIYIKDREMDGGSMRIEFFNSLESKVDGLKTPIVVGGGIRSVNQAESLLGLTYVKGIVIGSWLNRHELVVPNLKISPYASTHLRSLRRS
jgi:cyclase